MRLYSGTTNSLIEDPTFNRISYKLKDNFTQLVKNIYRLLLTRGLKGCYAYFVDKNTENFFRSRMEITAKAV